MNDKKEGIEDETTDKKSGEEKPSEDKKVESTEDKKQDEEKSASDAADKKDDKKSGEQPPSEVKSQVQADIKAEDLKPLEKKKKEGEAAPELPFKGYIAIKDKLKETPVEQFSYEIIQRTDGLNHLLLSDVNALMQSIAHDFPDIAKTYSIGKSFEGRDINVIELTKGGSSASETS